MACYHGPPAVGTLFPNYHVRAVCTRVLYAMQLSTHSQNTTNGSLAATSDTADAI